MADPEITLSVATANDKLKLCFPDDPKADVQIQLRNRIFRLQKAYLRLQSNYFLKNLIAEISVFKVKEQFNQQFFSNILQCLYGSELKVKRKDILDYFPIVKFLEIESILSQLKADMEQHTSEYNFFKLFDLCYRNNDQRIFQKCILQLEFHNYQQIKEDRHQMMKISKQLFKLIIKTHNKLSRDKKQLDAYEINNLITEYSIYHKLTPTEKKTLKFELIDKNGLNSKQYHDIFLCDSNSCAAKGFRQFSRAISLNTITSQSQFQHIMNTHSMTSLTYRKIILEMETTMERKISEQLKQKNTKLYTQLDNYSNETLNQGKKCKQIKQQFDNLRKKVLEKTVEQSKFSEKMKKIENSLTEIEKGMSSQDIKLKSLRQSTDELLQKYDLKPDEQSSEESAESSTWNITNEKNGFQFMPVKQDRQKQREREKQKSNRSILSEPNKNQQQGKGQTNSNSPNNNTKSNTNGKKNNPQQNSNTNINIKNQNSNTPNQYNSPRNANTSGTPFSPINSPKKKEPQTRYNFAQLKIQFDKEPKIIQSQKQLDSLSQILSEKSENFVKRKLLHIYSAKKNQKPSQSVTEQLRHQLQYKENILFLFRTQHGKLIGAFTSTSLNLNPHQISATSLDIADQNAYIFTVTHCKKYKVKKQVKSDAIMVNPGYLICFGFDLMISQNIFQEESYCEWPDRYQKQQNLKVRGCDWFVGGESLFSVDQIQCWQIQDIGDDMIL